MSYAVLHMKKINGNGVTGMQIHNQREKESDSNKDIDKERSHLNYDLENPNEINYTEKINSMIDEGVDQSKRKVRKDAVKIASFMVTSDKDFFERIGEKEEKRYFETAHKFIGDRYGKENIAYAMVHKDEKTPHMHVGFVPITEDKRLCAKDFFGKKQQLHSLQDDFHSHMKENGFNLERGLSSDSKHLEPAKFKLKTVQEKVTGLEAELEKKQNQKSQINQSIKGIETQLKDLNKSLDHTVRIGEIPFEEKGFLTKYIKLNRSDFDNMHLHARLSESSKVESHQFATRNAELEKKNINSDKKIEKLETKVSVLEKENKFLNRTIHQIKHHFKDHVQHLGQKIGYLKAEVLNKMGMKMLKKEFTDKDELIGGQSFLSIQEEKQKEKEQHKENENEHELE